MWGQKIETGTIVEPTVQRQYRQPLAIAPGLRRQLHPIDWKAQLLFGGIWHRFLPNKFNANAAAKAAEPLPVQPAQGPGPPANWCP